MKNEMKTPQIKNYVLAMFPYPSGNLHIGHVRVYAASEAFALHGKAMGWPTLHPMGWDAFGLPAERAAIEHGVDPREWTEKNIRTMRRQMDDMGFTFDWEREISTCDPSYYGGSQEIFVRLYRAGFIYKKESEVWWDPEDQTVLANEQVENGVCWRSGAKAVRKSMSMWHAKVSDMARDLYESMNELSWSSEAKARQSAWIGDGEHPRLHDWCISRQRKWGTPIPVATCSDCGTFAAPESSLPWGPVSETPTCPCPSCGKAAMRETDTLDTFWDSSWYQMRFPEIGELPTSTTVGDGTKRWAPPDVYVGGVEHATMHLLYARWMAKAMRVVGYDVPQEPFPCYVAPAMVKAKAYRRVDDNSWVRPTDVVNNSGIGRDNLTDIDGRPVECVGVVKMSKSALNGADPIAAANVWGAETVRLSLLFAAPFSNDVVWDDRSCKGPADFIARIQSTAAALAAAPPPVRAFDPAHLIEARSAHAQTWRKAWIEKEGINTAIASSMALLSEVRHAISDGDRDGAMEAFWDICTEIWPCIPKTIEKSAVLVFPEWKPGPPREISPPERRTPVQISGRTIGIAAIPHSVDADEAFEIACKEVPRFQSLTREKADRLIWIPGKALNYVLKK